MKLRVPPVTARNVASAVSLVVVVAFIAAFIGPAPEVSETPKVTRLLRKAKQQTGDGRSKTKNSDSPTAGFKAKSVKRSIFVTPRRGARSRLGTLEIPTIGLKRVFYEGVHDEVVKLGPGHWPGTPFPGNAGNAVFAGHRTTYTKPFADLDLLDRGDPIRTTLGKNKRLTYRVSKVYVVPEAEYVRSVLRQPKNKRARHITLFACTPKGFRTHRIVVRAVARPASRGNEGLTQRKGAAQ